VVSLSALIVRNLRNVHSVDILTARSRTDSRPSGTPSRFDAAFYRSHDPLAYISPDAQSAKSQGPYSSGLSNFTAAAGSFHGSFTQNGQRTSGNKRAGFGGYASSVISQDIGASSIDTNSVTGASTAPSERSVANITYSQSDRLRRRLSQSSAGVSDHGSHLAALDYKSQADSIDLDDMRTQYNQSQSGCTEY
jgi:regulator of nonsense transcripts 1